MGMMRNVRLSGLALSALSASLCMTPAPSQAADAGEQVAVGKAGPAVVAGSSSRTIIPLDRDWRFIKGDVHAHAEAFDDAGWQSVRLPHTWNRIGAYEPAAQIPTTREVDTYRGVAWYRRAIEVPRLGKDRRAWLEFDGASRRAEIWLNGVLLGAHDGGFSRFRFDASVVLRAGRNVLAIKVDNTQPEPGVPTAASLPLVGDFFVQGGLYRPARLVVTGATHFAMDDFGGPGVYARTVAVEDGAARVAVVSKLANDAHRQVASTLVTQLVTTEGKVAAEVRTAVKVGRSGGSEWVQDLDLRDAHLWNGVEDPYLYILRSELRDVRGRLLDAQEQAFGVRELRIDPDKGLFLNGRHLQLRGVGFHQDSMESGWAMTTEQIADRVATIRDMGANSIRLTHYQHGQPIHELADRYGLILWDEIALVTAWTLDEAQGPAPAAIVSQARQQLQELIRQNYNHPSVAVWGIANEVDFGPSRPDFIGRPVSRPSDPTPLLQELNALAVTEDPSRPTTMATCCEERGMPLVPDIAGIATVSAANRYFGWYYQKPEDLSAHLDSLRALRPAQPQGLSEYGAGGAFSIHTDDPRGGAVDMGGRNQPEEYQSWLHERTWPQIAARPSLWGSWLWNSFDFGTVTRSEGDSRDINTKGLVSYDGKVRKDAFYYYRANWSTRPTVHVNGRRYFDRAYPVTDVRVYSNAPETELFVNGRGLGKLPSCPERMCVWRDVVLAGGENAVEAIGTFAEGHQQRDAIAWRLDPTAVDSYRIDAGALVAEAVVGERFGSDAFFSGGTAGSLDKRPRGRPAILAPIPNLDRRAVLASFREGTFSYRLPLSPGRYSVTLSFVDGTAAPGERVFNVTAEGAAAIRALDVAALARVPLGTVTRTFDVEVGDGALDLAFVPRKGEAIVSTLTVTPTGERKGR